MSRMSDFIIVDETTSTNDFLKNLAKDNTLNEGFVVFTHNQTSGKGQRGNSWESAKGKNITLSFLFYPVFLKLHSHFLLSEAVALGVKDTLDSYLENIEIKWPNDIYCENRKIAGILIENEITGQQITSSVVGIGLNVNQIYFSDKAFNPISMKQVLKKDIKILPLLELLVDNVRRRYIQLKQADFDTIIADYHSFLYRKNDFHLFLDSDNNTFRAEIINVSEDGILHLRTSEGRILNFNFKEIIFV